MVLTILSLVENLKEFINDFIAGKIKPYIKSQPVPEKNDDPVKVVVGETFNQIVMYETTCVVMFREGILQRMFFSRCTRPGAVTVRIWNQFTRNSLNH